jgi:hypothetical protein
VPAVYTADKCYNKNIVINIFVLYFLTFGPDISRYVTAKPKGSLGLFFMHISNNIFVFLIMVTVHEGNKPPRLGAEIHRESGENLGAGRERLLSME